MTDAGDELFVYVLLDPCNPPRELMLQWNDGSWEHRAYWGENLIGYGANGTKSRRHMGPLPAAGRWTRLAVPARNLGLASRNVTGAAFTLYDGKAWFDRVGAVPCGTTPAIPSLPGSDVVWFDDAPPAGATLIGTWLWETQQKASGSQSFHRARSDSPHSFGYTTTEPVTLSSGDTIVVWVELDPCDPPQEMMVEFYDGAGWEHRAVWGTANILQGGIVNTASQRRMGAMPAAGEWVRLEVPASLVEVTDVYGMRFQLSDGHAWWDRPGQAPAQQAQSAREVRSPDSESEDEPEVRRVGWWSRLLPRRKAEALPVSMSIGASYVSHSSAERRYSIYSPALQLLAETATTTATAPPVAHEYIWFGGEPLAQVDTFTGEIDYYFNDHLGAPILQTDATGAVVWRVERDPYGERYATRVGAERHQPLGLPGQEYDVSSDRQYNIFRWYRAGWGRYTQADLLGLRAGTNLFRYSGGDPFGSADPLGLIKFNKKTTLIYDESLDGFISDGGDSKPFIKGDVNCVLNGCGKYEPRFTINIEYKVWYGDKSEIPHELEHVEMFDADLMAYYNPLINAEKKSYDTDWDCLVAGYSALKTLSNPSDYLLGNIDQPKHDKLNLGKWYLWASSSSKH